MQMHNMPILSQAGIYIPGVCRDLTGINSLRVEGKVQPLLKNWEKLTSGDIILADLSQYILIDKGGLQSASSIHVKFTTQVEGPCRSNLAMNSSLIRGSLNYATA